MSLAPIFIALLTLAAEPEVHEQDEKELVLEDDYEVRLSLPTEEDFEAWRHPGLRVQIGYSYSILSAMGSTVMPATRAHGFTLRPQIRLDSQWSIAADFTYAASVDKLSGIRWTATLEPTFHPIGGLGLSLGVGYGGMMASESYQDAPSAEYSYNADPSARLGYCEGSGWALAARTEYLFVAGQIFATGPFVQADLNWVSCEKKLGSNDPETGEPVVLRQWWRYNGLGVGWWLTWR